MAQFVTPALARSVLVVEDHEVARFGLVNFLRFNKNIQHVEGCETMAEAMQALGRQAFELAIFDLDLPDVSDPLHPVALEGVRRTFPAMKVAVMSGFDHRDYILAALAAGAHGYIPKRCALEQVAVRLAKIMAGEIYVPASLAEIDVDPPVVERADEGKPTADLTPRQLEVLELMTEGLTNKLIGKRLDLTESTIKLHASGLYQQLGVKNRSQAIVAGQKYLNKLRPSK